MHLANLLDAPAATFGSKTALLSGDIVVTYERLQRDVETVAQHLAASGIVAGQTVGVYLGQSASHWCVLLALLRLGAVSVSLTNRFDAEIEALPNLSAVICSDDHRPIGRHTIPLMTIRAEWVRTRPDRPVSLPPPEDAEQRFGRICFTSGTAGTPKAIILDANTLKRRLAKTAERSRVSAQSCLWCGLGPDSAYGFTATLATWATGGTVCFVTGPDQAHTDLIRGRVNVIIASPAALTAVLQKGGTQAGGRIEGPVIVAGGRLSARLRDLVRETLSPEVLIAYGSSETGGVTLTDAGVLDRDPGNVGSPFPDVEAEVVDDNGRVAGAGTPGRIRIKSGGAVSGYLNDPEATVRHFADGWFYPGDIAEIAPDGHIVLRGRPAEMLNVGGVKLLASELDDAARSHAGIEDACAIVLSHQGGAARLAIAVAGQPDAIRGLAPALRSLLPSLPPFSVVPVSRIPRNSMGKLNRDTFAQDIAQQLHEGAPVGDASFTLIQEL